MKIYEAYKICNDAVGKPFNELFQSLEKGALKNKGKIGQLMEQLCGLKLSNTMLDFEDGELKTTALKESTALIMITDWIDEIIHVDHTPFEESKLYKKINRMILMPIDNSSSDPNDWTFTNCIFINMNERHDIFEVIKNDYNKICKIAHEQVYNGDGYLHTISGKYLQIRTKDAGGEKSKPIYSSRLGRKVTKKSRMAFYLMANFCKVFK